MLAKNVAHSPLAKSPGNRMTISIGINTEVHLIIKLRSLGLLAFDRARRITKIKNGDPITKDTPVTINLSSIFITNYFTS